MKYPLVILAALSLSACAGARQRTDSPPPVVDTSVMSKEQIAMFSKDEKACRRIQQKVMPTSLFDALSAPDVHAYNARREEKASTIMRNCLQQKGHNVIY